MRPTSIAWWRDEWCLFWLVVALVVRIGYASQLTGLERSDPVEYDAIAWNAAQGVGFTNRGLAPHESWVRRPPGFPALLAAVYLIFGHDLLAARIAQCVVGALLCAATCALAAAVAPLSVVRAVAAVSALYPYLVYYSGYLMSENLGALLFCVALWSWASPQRSLAWDFAGGVVLGAAGLTRSMFLGFVAPLAVWFATSDRKSTAAARWGAVLLGTALVVTPWLARNHRLTGKIILQSDSVAGFYRWHLWFSQDDFWEEDSWNRFSARNPELFRKLRGLPDVELDEALAGEAVRYVVSDPGRYLRSCVRKFLWFWRPSTFAFTGTGVVRSGAFWVSLGAYVVWLPAFAHGLVLLWRRGTNGRLLVWAVLYVTAFHTFYWYGSPRFRFPIYPMFLIACCSSIENVWTRLSERRIR